MAQAIFFMWNNVFELALDKSRKIVNNVNKGKRP